MRRISAALILIFFILSVACKGGGARGVPPSETLPFNDISAFDLIRNINVGWNLGNALDARYDSGTAHTSTVRALETAWGNPQTTKANIDAIKTAGFNAVRIPVTWHKVIDSEYNIRADWMERVTEIVNYASLNDMYVILNTYHDENLFVLSDKMMPQTEKAFIRIWQQIAENFKNYDEKLMFEAMSAPRIFDSPDEWNSDNTEGIKNLNTLNQIFVDTIRNTGGSNEKRILIITTFISSLSGPAVDSFILPKDTAADKLIIAVRGFIPYNFTHNPGGGWSSTWSKSFLGDTVEIDETLSIIENLFISRGVPVIIIEMGAINRNNNDSRAEWAEYFVSRAKERNIPCFWWDNGVTELSTATREGFGIFNRSSNKVEHEEIIDALLRGAGE
ncbi:MAG: glycoside hydrolase family 5 protein [Oscillospiraceae bacterium]|nr:glycoside hydrolase family 5 protein [Oscillospiraceae bacterium]